MFTDPACGLAIYRFMYRIMFYRYMHSFISPSAQNQHHKGWEADRAISSLG
jgi:hypothetical protein